MNTRIAKLAALPLLLALAIPVGATAQECNGNKVPICHHPPGNPDNLQSICIAEASWPSHESHGDTRGFCAAELSEITCGEPQRMAPGTVEMEVVATGWKMTGPYAVETEGPVAIDSYECGAADEEKWSCRWRGSGEPSFDGPQSVKVRFDQVDGNSAECSLAAVDGLPVELIGFSVD